ncbi:hypothetical protein GCM10027275_51170 [Rhabdobacter roseus]|uniref:Uncharacterized protein n=1 Tax=Rhabdobacter roseus TaxID=1655419 RepID=A0A840TTB0_9BACT|nr:hypothetical protein [Rhabdobacter roseus]MBB5287191.1 hypothetical protein [Rhabdobacter roseus]
MKKKLTKLSLEDLVNQAENAADGLEDISPEEAEELTGGGRNSGCPSTGGDRNTGCPVTNNGCSPKESAILE